MTTETAMMTYEECGIKEENYDVMQFKGTDWKNMPLKEWLQFAKANKLYGEPGISYREIWALYESIEKNRLYHKWTNPKPMTILETGQCYGTTTRFFLVYTLKYGGEHYSCEVKIRDLFKSTMTELGLWDKINQVGDSRICYWPPERSIDFLFIDSEHCMTDALGEYMKFRTFVRAEGLVGFHDTECCIGVKRAIQVIQEMDELELVSECSNNADAGIKIFRILGRGTNARRETLKARMEETERLNKERGM